MSTPTRTDSTPAVTPVAPNLRHAFGGIWRLTAARLFTRAHALGFFGLLVLLGLVATAMVRSRHGPADYLQWSITTYFTFLAPIVAFLNVSGAIRDEMKSASVDYVLTRPVPRVAFVAFRFVAQLCLIEAELLLAGCLMIAIGAAHHVEGVTAGAPALLGTQAVLVLAFGALGLLAGVLTARYVVVGLAYGAIVEVGVGQIPTQLSRLSLTHRATVLLEHALEPAKGVIAASAGSVDLPSTMLYAVGVAVLAVGAAALLFHWRECGGSAET